MKLRCILLTLITLDCVHAAAAGFRCPQHIVSDSSSHASGRLEQPTSFAAVARAQGIQGLVHKLSIHVFANTIDAILQSRPRLGNGQTAIPNSFELASSQGEPKGTVAWEDPAITFPLRSQDAGKWADLLIGDNSSRQREGVRERGTFEWSVGLVVPVEVLDLYPFLFHFFPGGRWPLPEKLAQKIKGTAFDSSQQTPQEFLELLTWMNEVLEAQYGDRPTATSIFPFELQAGVSLKHLDYFWVPLPFYAWLQEHVSEFLGFAGVGNSAKIYRTKDPYPPVRIQFATRVDPNNPSLEPANWKVVPATSDSAEFLFSGKKVRTWFDIVPKEWR